MNIYENIMKIFSFKSHKNWFIEVLMHEKQEYGLNFINTIISNLMDDV